MSNYAPGKVTYLQLIKFFTPLAVLPVMISLTHVIVNSTLSRLPLPELNIAIFTVVKGISDIINAPTLMSRQLIVSLVDDKVSYIKAKKFLWAMSAILSSTLILLAVTPIGGLLFEKIIGFKDNDKTSLALSALIIIAFLPIVVNLRNIYQGVVTALKKTEINLPGIMLRLVALIIFSWWLIRTEIMPGVIAVSLAWVVGIAIEGIFIYCYIVYKYGSIDEAISDLPARMQSELTVNKMLKFFLPLASMIILTMFVRPIIQSGLAHSKFPVNSLAGFGVAFTLVLVVVGPLKMINQMIVVHTDRIEGVNWFKLKRFSLFLGIILTCLLILLALTPVGYWILRTGIGVSDLIAGISQKTLLAFCLLPLIHSIRETYWGVLMVQRTTTMIAIAKIANIIVVSFVVFAGIAFIKLNPAVIGALSYTLGEGIETLLIWRYTVSYS